MELLTYKNYNQENELDSSQVVMKRFNPKDLERWFADAKAEWERPYK